MKKRFVIKNLITGMYCAFDGNWDSDFKYAWLYQSLEDAEYNIFTHKKEERLAIEVVYVQI